MSRKVAVITGGSRGIGKEIALAFAKENYDIVINYTSNESAAIEVKNEIENLGAKSVIYKADVSKGDEVKAFASFVKNEMGKVDVLVNNAGVTRDNLIFRISEDDLDKVIDINLKGTFLCSKYFGKIMAKDRSGVMINISSVIGITGNAGQSNYAASKAGVIGLTKSLAKELAGRNIRVNAIAPGFIETEMTGKLSDDVKDSYMSRIPLGCFGKAEDIAMTAIFLASENARYITGTTISVDGGLS